MTYAHPREPHARALLDYFKGDTEAALMLHSSLGEHEELPISIFFREPEEFFPFERAALELCRGRVLDVGAGTGVHSLYLQARGFEVTAIEVLVQAVEIMQRRGVRDARLADIAELEDEPFDTILMMMNGIGIVGTLDGLDGFLRDIPRLLKPGGQILVDSGPGRIVGDPHEGAVQVPAAEGEYHGEALIVLEYRGAVAPPFRELYVDSETFTEHAAAAGWDCEIVFRGELSDYVARLTRVHMPSA